MGKTKQIKVADLQIDLTNYRTVHQPDEEHATNALISIHPNYFGSLSDPQDVIAPEMPQGIERK